MINNPDGRLPTETDQVSGLRDAATVDDEIDTRALLAIAEAAVDEAETTFTAAVGADPSVIKSPGDFATEADLSVERQLRTLLTRYTGLPVHGEEYGIVRPGEQVELNPNDEYADEFDGPRRPHGPSNPGLHELPETCWVVDPIDGTANYAVGNPFCCILVSLVHKGEAVVSVCEMPLLGRRISARKGHGLFVDGHPARPMPPSDPGITQIGFGSILSQRRGNLPVSYRQDMLNAIGETYPRMRVSGSCGIDLAFTAAGVFGGTVTFSPNLWDNCAGILMIRENGGKVTDFAGNRWVPGVSGIVAGEPEVHANLLAHIQSVPIGTAARTTQDVKDRGGIQ